MRRVAVEFFKASGKYYTTEYVSWLSEQEDSPCETLRRSLHNKVGERFKEMYAVCVNSPAGVPLMLLPGDRWQSTQLEHGIFLVECQAVA